MIYWLTLSNKHVWHRATCGDTTRNTLLRLRLRHSKVRWTRVIEYWTCEAHLKTPEDSLISGTANWLVNRN